MRASSERTYDVEKLALAATSSCYYKRKRRQVLDQKNSADELTDMSKWLSVMAINLNKQNQKIESKCANDSTDNIQKMGTLRLNGSFIEKTKINLSNFCLIFWLLF